MSEIVFEVLCAEVLEALRGLGLGKFSIRNYYYEGMRPIIKAYRSEGVIFYSIPFTSEVVDRFRAEHENGLVSDHVWMSIRKVKALFEEYTQTGEIIWQRLKPEPKVCISPYYQEILFGFRKHEANTRLDITYSNITGFLEWLSSSRNCSPATINLRLMAIRSFTKYAGILDPAKIHTQVEISNISIRKMPGKVVEFLSMPALNTLMEQPNRLKANGYRDFCFMKLMYDTAARCRELVNAKIGDLDLRKSYTAICLTGKGNKMRVVPISPSMSTLLKEYMDTVHPIEQRQNSDYLFFTTLHGRRTRMSTDAVSLFMKKYGELANHICSEVPKRVHPHQLRHSRAMHLYRAGMPLVLLSEFLGHADVNTTRVYAWADTETKRQAIQKISGNLNESSVAPIWENDEEMIKRLYGLA